MRKGLSEKSWEERMEDSKWWYTIGWYLINDPTHVWVCMGGRLFESASEAMKEIQKEEKKVRKKTIGLAVVNTYMMNTVWPLSMNGAEAKAWT